MSNPPFVGIEVIAVITNIFHEPERHALVGHEEVASGLVGQDECLAAEVGERHVEGEFDLGESSLWSVL